jgi:hypothetical protein
MSYTADEIRFFLQLELLELFLLRISKFFAFSKVSVTIVTSSSGDHGYFCAIKS